MVLFRVAVAMKGIFLVPDVVQAPPSYYQKITFWIGDRHEYCTGNRIVSRPLSLFDRIAKRAEYYTGHPFAFGAALFIILIWGMAGTMFHYSDSWQLFINTGTTIVTFLMVFVIQSNQNRATLPFSSSSMKSSGR
jgi:hypothetical protein